MDGRRLILILCSGILAVGLAPWAPAQEKDERHRDRPPREGRSSDRVGEALEMIDRGDAAGLAALIDRLPPERREQFRQNLERWKQMTPEQRQAMRFQDRFRKKRLQAEAEKLMAEMGDQLAPEKRQEFMRRFEEGRHKIDEQLFREMAQKRRPMMDELVRQLRMEFQVRPGPGEGSLPPPQHPHPFHPDPQPPQTEPGGFRKEEPSPMTTDPVELSH